MNYRTAIAAALLAVAGSASACVSVNVTVLPLTVAENITMPVAKIVEFTHGVGQLGVVVASYSARVSGCNVEVGYTDVTLFVAREMKRDACAFDHVMVHEQEHVHIYQEALSTIEARIEARAGEADLLKVAAQELAAVKVAQKAHDSEEEYHANSTACNGRIPRLAGLR